jgi:hypothetical protein
MDTNSYSTQLVDLLNKQQYELKQIIDNFDNDKDKYENMLIYEKKHKDMYENMLILQEKHKYELDNLRENNYESQFMDTISFEKKILEIQNQINYYIDEVEKYKSNMDTNVNNYLNNQKVFNQEYSMFMNGLRNICNCMYKYQKKLGELELEKQKIIYEYEVEKLKKQSITTKSFFERVKTIFKFN